MAGVVVVLIGMVANLFLQLPALHLAISAVFILISSGAILFETSNIIRGGGNQLYPRDGAVCMSRCTTSLSAC